MTRAYLTPRVLPRARGLEPKAREGIEHDLGEGVEIADQEREEADVKGLLDQVGKQILLSAPCPEQA